MISRLPRRRCLLAILVPVLLTVAGCAASDTSADPTSTTTGGSKLVPPASAKVSTPTSARPVSSAPAVAAPGKYGVGSLEETYVDRTRRTQRNGSAPAKPERTLPTLILYPAASGAGADTATDSAPPAPGPWPLIVFSHGVGGSAEIYETTLRVIASAGYVVVAPNYPLSNKDAPGGSSIKDVPAQTHDVAFLIDRVLKQSGPTEHGGLLGGLIDPNRIGIAGHSLGAITSLGVGYQVCCVDRRVKAVAEWAGLFFPLDAGGKSVLTSKGRPLLILHGNRDETVPYAGGQAVYRRSSPPKYFITLPDAGHIPAYLQGLGTPQSKVVSLATIDFFDRYLKGDPSGIARLHRAVTAAGTKNATEQEQAS